MTPVSLARSIVSSPALWLPVFLSSILLAAAPAAAQTKLLRFPDLHDDQVVFTYAGDLWLVSSEGGRARRLTTHPGLELFAKFSPDGRSIAFTGQYDGDEQVYVVPVEGGAPRQLTFYPAEGPLPPRWGYDNHVYGWTPDGERIVFRSMRDGWDMGDARLYTVPHEGGLPEPLPMPVSGAGDLSPDGDRIAYSPLSRDFRHWKRYQGGWAQDLYVFDLETYETRRITDHPRTDRDPMWIGGKIYFSSDRDGTLNLYAYDVESGATEQLTHSDVWDLRWPGADAAGGRIVYEKAGELEIYDVADGSSRALSIQVPDDGVAARPARMSVANAIENLGLSPEGKRALFAARGDLFTVPAEHGPVRSLTRTSDAHDREPAWSPDGRRIAFVSDRDGEEEVYLVDQDGHGRPRQLTDGSRGSYFNLVFSPTGRHLALRNQKNQLFVLDVSSRELVEVADDAADAELLEVVDDAAVGGLTYSWSPDGRFLALSLEDPNSLRSIFIWSLEDRRLHRVTGELWNEQLPAWGPEGKYLYFVGDREFGPLIDGFEWNYALDRTGYLYAVALREDVAHPFPPRSDEVDGAGKEEGGKEGKEESGKESAGKESEGADASGGKAAGKPAIDPIRIDFEGLGQRVARVPVEAGNYAGLAAVDGHLLYLRSGSFYLGRQNPGSMLYVYSLEKREEMLLAENVTGAALSPDGSKVLVQQGGSFQILDARPGGKDSAKPLSTAGLEADVVPAEEWAQIFDEVWRRFRDFFYVENMHGYDWEALRERYRPLLAHVAHRSDLNYLLSEMIAELNVSHAYVAGGDYEVPDRPHAALLGARFELDSEAGRYRISEILPGHNQEDAYRSPLTEIGVDVAVGDYLLAINGRELTAEDNPFRLLRHAGGAPVELTVNDSPAFEGARRVMVAPIASEDPLLYLAWIESKRRYVEEASDGRIGYLHIPDMGASGLREFIKWYYGQVRKQGLVIDVRSNGGGNVSQMILERLRRDLLMVDFERNLDRADTYPNVVFHGHMATLLNEDTASDGDQFAYVFREAGLGPLIGKRSWGGVVGIYGRWPLIDGGSVMVPEAGSANPAGEWVVEGHGVDPNIVVENDPKMLIEGRDQQLDKAIEVLLERIETEPMKLPERPEPPVKTE